MNNDLIRGKIKIDGFATTDAFVAAQGHQINNLGAGTNLPGFVLIGLNNQIPNIVTGPRDPLKKTSLHRTRRIKRNLTLRHQTASNNVNIIDGGQFTAAQINDHAGLSGFGR